MSEFEEKSAEWYESLEESLADADCEISAAEFQGVLAGMISAGLKASDKNWQATILEVANDGIALPEAASQQLKLIFDESQKAFQEQDLLAPILLPGEDYPIVDRLEALSFWCQGYLLGFGLQLGGQLTQSKEVTESLQDISDISHLEVAADDSEDSQSALITVTEHIKVAVKVIYLDIVLKPQHELASKAAASKTLH